MLCRAARPTRWLSNRRQILRGMCKAVQKLGRFVKCVLAHRVARCSAANASGRLRQASWTPASARATAPPPRVVPAPQRWFPLRIPLVGTPLVGTADARPRCHGLNLGMKKGPTGVAGPWSEFNSEVPLMLDHRPANPGTAGVRRARLPIAPPRLKCLSCFQHWPFCTTGRLVSVRLKPVPPKSEL
jgi:hypothetical protein